MTIEQYKVSAGYKLVKVKARPPREPRKDIIRIPKVLPPNIRMAIEIAAGVARRIHAKKEAAIAAEQ